MDSLESITIGMNDINTLVDETAPAGITPAKRVHDTKAWPKERVDDLRRMFFQVPIVSYRIIAKELGISRCAVAGKVKRLGLAESCPTKYAKRQPTVCKPARTSAGRTRRKSTTEPGKPLTLFWRAHDKPIEEPETAEPVVVEFIPPNPVRLVDAGEFQCRWPITEPTSEMLVCGEPTRDQLGCPYCSFHARIAYKPSAPRKPWVEGRVGG